MINCLPFFLSFFMEKQISKAFTIVEMALVIIIIGVLMVAIIGGRELVDQAKAKKIISEFEMILNASQSFRSTYDDMPGDMPDAYLYFLTSCDIIPEKCNGDGDGRVEGVGMVMPNNDDNESLRSFQHLALAEMFLGSFTGVGYNPATGEGCNVGAKLSVAENCIKKRGVNVFPTVFDNYGYYIIYYDNVMKHVIQLGKAGERINDTVNAGNNGGVLLPRFAYKVDKKFDDSVATTGLMRAVLSEGNLASSTSCYNTLGEYNLDLKVEGCGLKLSIR